jgi:hypothetical protein
MEDLKVLERIKKTPSKFDDFLVLGLGLITLFLPLLRLTGILRLPFDYVQVVFGGLIPMGMVGYAYIMAFLFWWRSGRTSPFKGPEPEYTLLLPLGLINILPVWQVSIVAENTGVSFVWFILMAYFLVAAILGTYNWPIEFVRLLAGVVSGALGVANSVKPQKTAKPVDESYTQETVETEVVSQPIPDHREAYLPRPAQNTFRPMTATPPSLPEETEWEERLDLAVNGDTDALASVATRLAKLSPVNLSNILTGVGMPQAVFDNKVMPGISGDPSKLLDVFKHPAFSRQRPAFLKALETE